MKTELHEKLQQLKAVLRRLDLNARLAIVEKVKLQLPPEALKTRDSQHDFSAENLLEMALVTPHADNKCHQLYAPCGNKHSTRCGPRNRSCHSRALHTE